MTHAEGSDPIDKPPVPLKAATPGGKPQRTLANLLREISQCRSEISNRKALLSDLQQRLVSEAYPLQEKALAIRVETFRILGRHLRSGRLPRRAGALLESALYDLAEELETGFGADLREDRRWIFAEEHAHPESGEADSDDSDEPGSWGADGYRESDFAERPDPENRSAGKASGPGQGAPGGATGRRAGGAEGGQGKPADREMVIAGDIRALYLILARALHPDKEPDAALREGKTAWMQKVTAAYADRDLARLLDILSANPLGAVEPYLSMAPERTIRGFAKRLRRDLEGLRAALAGMVAGADPYLARFLTGNRIDEFAFKTFLAQARKENSFLTRRREAYRTQAGVDGLVEALRSHDWRELL